MINSFSECTMACHNHIDMFTILSNIAGLRFPHSLAVQILPCNLIITKTRDNRAIFDQPVTGRNHKNIDIWLDIEHFNVVLVLYEWGSKMK